MLSNLTRAASILIVEDEIILALDLSVRLEAEGYSVSGTAATGRQALALYEQQPVDIVLCDISLKGDWNGIETARNLMNHRPVPVIFISALSDAATLEQAKPINPAAYLIKPLATDSLRVAIEIALSNADRVAVKKEIAPPPVSVPYRDGETILQVGDYIFIKQNYQFVRLHQAELLYAEADDKYTTLVTRNRKFVLRLSLAVLLQRLVDVTLVRIHRSFAVNIGHIESFSDYEVQVPGQTLPLGRVYKEDFLRRFRFR